MAVMVVPTVMINGYTLSDCQGPPGEAPGQEGCDTVAVSECNLYRFYKAMRQDICHR
jgi:hypothetical protein